MREIRFRTWDNVKNHMYSIGEESDIHFELTSGGTFIGYDLNEDEDSPLRKLEHLKYMQYTGLKDKNGVEVYEGDVLKVYEISERHELEYSSPVEFIDYGFLVTEPNKTQVPLACFGHESSYPLFEIEVIGNIYENSEQEDPS